MTAPATKESRLIRDLRRLAKDLTWELNPAGPKLADLLTRYQQETKQ